jgi:hypothetical protein
LRIAVGFANGRVEVKRVLTSEKITAENYARVENGMTTAEVVDILGPPFQADLPGEGVVTRLPRGKHPKAAFWQTPDIIIWVVFADDKVAGKRLITKRTPGK